ncbi:hypothetical protein [Winogradskyella sp. A2]|uniref:hypothetical protein n=1 Tax=Winogradskyella sp. A2 TaxID=3366944 RepID=UPI00398C2797
MKRIYFLKSASLGILGITGSSLVFGQNSIQEEPPQLDKALVKEFVGASHGRIDRVKVLIKEHPTLLNAAYDWRAGDFETGLGAASHVGHKELVKFFLNKGAQANIFTMALFGQLNILKAMLEFNPLLLHAKGPHGYTLLHHAEQGGDEAIEVAEFLKSEGLKETIIRLY